MVNLQMKKIRLFDDEKINVLIFDRLKELGVDSHNSWKRWDDSRYTPGHYYINGDLKLTYTQKGSKSFESELHSEITLTDIFNHPSTLEIGKTYLVRPDLVVHQRYGNDSVMHEM